MRELNHVIPPWRDGKLFRGLGAGLSVSALRNGDTPREVAFSCLLCHSFTCSGVRPLHDLKNTPQRFVYMQHRFCFSLPILLSLLLLAGGVAGCSSWVVPGRPLSPEVEDERIASEISTAFQRDALVDFLDIKAYSYGGEVYLIGESGGERESNRAVEIAKSVDGVASVNTYILVEEPLAAGEDAPCTALDKARIESRVRADLLAAEDLSRTRVDVTMVRCRIVLTGTAVDAAAAGGAENVARGVAEQDAAAADVRSFLIVAE